MVGIYIRMNKESKRDYVYNFSKWFYEMINGINTLERRKKNIYIFLFFAKRKRNNK